MKRILAAIMIVTLAGYCAFAEETEKTKTPETEASTTAEAAVYKTYGEAMKVGMALKKTGDVARAAYYQAFNGKKYEEAKIHEKIWRNDHPKAAAAFAEAVKLAQNDGQKCRALKEQAMTHFSQNLKEAVKLMQQAYVLKPENGEINYLLTWLMNQAGMYKEGCKVAEKFLKDGNYKKQYATSIISDNYIGALLQLKRFEDAKKINAELVKINPNLDKTDRIKKAEAAASK